METETKKEIGIALYGVIRKIKAYKWGGFFYLDTFEGVYQCVLKGDSIKQYKSESYVKVVGSLVDAKIETKLVVSDQEIQVEKITVITEPGEQPGINIYAPELLAEQSLIFDQRAFTLRHNRYRCIFKIQSEIMHQFCDYLHSLGFYRISTPKIVANGAEGGTDVFMLDYFGKTACLAQSPQLYKQMCCGAFGFVYESGPVFRAEKHDSARHVNEYHSLDVEMKLNVSFSELISLESDFLEHLFSALRETCKIELDYLGIELDGMKDNVGKALNITVAEAMEILGATGYDLSSEQEKAICEYAKKNHQTDFVFLREFHKSVKPFYTKVSPDGEHTESFDLLFKGTEITSGGQRKHSYQEYIDSMRQAGMNTENFAGYLEAFRYGMPLHGGFAVGLERLTALICNMDSVKDATLFPRFLTRLQP